LLASGGYDGKVRLRDATTGQLLHVGEKHQGRVTGLIFRDRDTLVSGAQDGAVKIWDVATAKVRREFKIGPPPGPRSVAALAVTADGSLLATAGDGEKTVRLWELPAGREVASFDTESIDSLTWPLAFSPDGKTLAAGGWSNGVIQLWDVATRRVRELPFGRE